MSSRPLQPAFYTNDPASLAARMTAATVAEVARAEPMELEEAVQLYSGYVATIAYRLLGREDEVDDVVQEVFLVALKGLSRLRDDGAVRGWLATVTTRTAHRRLRQRRLSRLVGLDDAPDYRETLAAPGANPEELATLARVYALLDTLPVDARVAWALRYIHGDGLDAVAQACGCSLATVKRRIQVAWSVIERFVGDE